MKETTCCFTGHRKLPTDQIEHIVIRLNDEIDNLISQGVTTFISGGALGFDQVAAIIILGKKEVEQTIRLIFALPCRDFDAPWNAEQKSFFHSLLAAADEIIYISEEYSNDCLKKRNHYMVDRSAYCICAYLYPTGGTVQTVKYARQKGIKVINTIKQYA